MQISITIQETIRVTPAIHSATKPSQPLIPKTKNHNTISPEAFATVVHCNRTVNHSNCNSKLQDPHETDRHSKRSTKRSHINRIRPPPVAHAAAVKNAQILSRRNHGRAATQSTTRLNFGCHKPQRKNTKNKKRATPPPAFTKFFPPQFASYKTRARNDTTNTSTDCCLGKNTTTAAIARNANCWWERGATVVDKRPQKMQARIVKKAPS